MSRAEDERPLKRPLEGKEREQEQGTREKSAGDERDEEQKKAAEERNRQQVGAILRAFDLVDDQDDKRPHGRFGSSDAEALLIDSPSGTWLLRLDPGRRRMMLSIKDGEGHVSHHETDADGTDATILRYRVRRELMLPHRETLARSAHDDRDEAKPSVKPPKATEVKEE